MTSCSALAEIDYASGTVDTLETTVVYRTGNFGWGYYGPLGRFYGPNYLNYYSPIYGPRIIVNPRARTTRTRTTVVTTPRRRGGVVRSVPRTSRDNVQPRTRPTRSRGTAPNRGRRN